MTRAAEGWKKKGGRARALPDTLQADVVGPGQKMGSDCVVGDKTGTTSHTPFARRPEIRVPTIQVVGRKKLEGRRSTGKLMLRKAISCTSLQGRTSQRRATVTRPAEIYQLTCVTMARHVHSIPLLCAKHKVRQVRSPAANLVHMPTLPAAREPHTMEGGCSRLFVDTAHFVSARHRD